VKKSYAIMKNQSLIIGSMICIVLLMNACATFKKPATINEAPIQERALTKEANGIRASAAVVGDQEAIQIFGIDLTRKKIQAVWIEIENNTDRPIILLPTAIDHEYIPPMEVAFAYHRAFAVDANSTLDEHLLNMNFPTRNLIRPGSRASGYIFTNWLKGVKVIDIDLVGDNLSQNFTFFTPNPNNMAHSQAIIDHMETMFSTVELKKLESETELRELLEQLPCCVSNEKGGPSAEPLNVVIIGAIEDWTTAFFRRGYSYQELNPRYAFGRVQDVSGKKLSRVYIKGQELYIRLWQTPIQYQGKPVWVGQTSSRLGGRFADTTSAEVTLPMNPHVDEARDALTQDLAYSQALIKMGFIKGSGSAQSTQTEVSLKDYQYTTDGLRVVLVFAERPSSLEEIDFFNWERLADYR
jgi:hypothetical protein